MSDYISEEFSNPLPGYALKSNICYKGANIHCGSLILKDKFFPSYNATVIELLHPYEVLMTTHMDEFKKQFFQ